MIMRCGTTNVCVAKALTDAAGEGAAAAAAAEAAAEDAVDASESAMAFGVCSGSE